MTEDQSTNEMQSSLLSPDHWVRLVYMLLFGLMLHVASIIMWVLVPLQFIFVLFTDEDNENLRSLGKSITEFIAQALNFVTYNTEIKPFPVAAWPGTRSSVYNGNSLVDSGDSDFSDDVETKE